MDFPFERHLVIFIAEGWDNIILENDMFYSKGLNQMRIVVLGQVMILHKISYLRGSCKRSTTVLLKVQQKHNNCN